jgi:hypothetical protein
MEDLAAGTPDYGRMSRELATLTRADLTAIHKQLSSFGPISARVFQRVTADGAALYHVTWKQAAGDAGVVLGADGTIERAFFQMDGD